MSHYWDLYCVTCDVPGNVFGWNHGREALRMFVPHMTAFAALAPAVAAFEATGRTLEIVVGGGAEWQSGLIQFAAAHLGHHIRPRSEDGIIDETCAVVTACAFCEKSFLCQLTSGHEGEHAPRCKQ